VQDENKEVCHAILMYQIYKIILEPTPEMPEQAHRPEKGRSILNRHQATSPISEAITAPNNEYSIRN